MVHQSHEEYDDLRGPRHGMTLTTLMHFLARLYLNVKGLPYKTVWVPLRDVQSTMPALGFSPKGQGGRPFSIPAIEWRGGKLMDSWQIAKILEKAYPTPTLNLDAPAVLIAEETTTRLFDAIRPIVSKKIFSSHLFEQDRQFMLKERLGPAGVTSIEQMSDESDKTWNVLFEHLQTFIDLLKEHSEGPFILGKDISYADIYLAAFLVFVRQTDKQDYEKIVRHDQSISAFVAAAEPWTKRMD